MGRKATRTEEDKKLYNAEYYLLTEHTTALRASCGVQKQIDFVDS